MTRVLPPVRGSGRIALGLARRFCPRENMCVLPIWPGIRMMLDPGDCVGRLLAFVPHLYERWERRAMASILRPGDTFVDIGSNIGAYALWAAHCLGPSGRVLAVEPDSQNYAHLVYNIRLNGFESRIVTMQCGISDLRQSLRLHRNVTGNRGAHSFLGVGAEGPMVECLPLDEALHAAGLQRVRMMKLDIEGFERRVLDCYFNRVAGETLPEYLLVEIEGGPAPDADKRRLRHLIAGRGYTLLRDGPNSLYGKRDTEPICI